ncbi:MAG: lytic murein transglycosylase [Francisella sp.]|nr:MAG: lytic murein transglycosylase [Francisella sp.]
MKKLIYSSLILISLASCTNHNTPNVSGRQFIIKESLPITIQPQEIISEKRTPFINDVMVINEYRSYQEAKKSLSKGDTSLAEYFLAQRGGKHNAMISDLRVNLLRIFAEKDNWYEFKKQYVQLSMTERNQLGAARRLAQAMGQTLNSSALPGTKAYKVNQLIPVITKRGRNRADLEAALAGLYGKVDVDDLGFAEGVAGYSRARDLQMTLALLHFDKADRSQLSHTQWEWYARAALRSQLWSRLEEIIRAMPSEVREQPTWWYWLARANAKTGHYAQANELYQKAARSGRNFYAILASEELHQEVSVVSTSFSPSKQQISDLQAQNGIFRALVLFNESIRLQDRTMRHIAQLEWRYAVKHFSNLQLLTAAQLAFNQQFYEMSIYSADKSEILLNFPLRFPTPYRSVIENYAQKNQVELPWVLGLIRQESRFMSHAVSSSQAGGLMQILPSVAKFLTKKMGLSIANTYDVASNVNMGTWYLADLYRSFAYSLPVATSAYNAGPSRAKQWQQFGLEGAIYTETIPFRETRDYVKKVMSNTYYYSRLLAGKKKSLKEYLGH